MKEQSLKERSAVLPRALIRNYLNTRKPRLPPKNETCIPEGIRFLISQEFAHVVPTPSSTITPSSSHKEECVKPPGGTPERETANSLTQFRSAHSNMGNHLGNIDAKPARFNLPGFYGGRNRNSAMCDFLKSPGSDGDDSAAA